MMTPVLFYCATRAQADALAKALGGNVLAKDNDPNKVIDDFHAHGGVVCTTEEFARGWRAPSNALIVFIDGFTHDLSVRFQANVRNMHRKGTMIE